MDSFRFPIIMDIEKLIKSEGHPSHLIKWRSVKVAARSITFSKRFRNAFQSYDTMIHD